MVEKNAIGIMSKVEPMKTYLANLGKERIDEVFDSEIAARNSEKEEKTHRLSENINAVSKENTLNYKYTDELKENK